MSAPVSSHVTEFEVPLRRLGLENPPVPMRARLLRSSAGWQLLVRAPEEDRDEVQRWLEALKPAGLTVTRGHSAAVGRALFQKPPASWSRTLRHFRRIDLELAPEGEAKLRVEGRPQLLDRLGHSLGARRRVPRMRPEVFLSERQMDLVQRAAELGYYDVPRRRTLRQVAQQLGRSPATVSEGLRKAEREIIVDFLRRQS